MSTATQRQTTTTTAYGSHLDTVLEATQKRSIVSEVGSILGVDPSKVCDLLREVWHTSKDEAPLTDREMFRGLSLIARYGLDPIAKEVYVTRSKGKMLTIIAIDGWVKVLDRTDGYDGFEWEDETDDGGNVVAVNVKIYSTKRTRPVTYRGLMREYMQVAGIVARSMPVHMLRLFSLRHAARLFTPIGGDVLTEEEAKYVVDRYGDAADREYFDAEKTSKSTALADSLKKRFAEPTAQDEAEAAPRKRGRPRKEQQPVEVAVEPEPAAEAKEEAVEPVQPEKPQSSDTQSLLEQYRRLMDRAANVMELDEVRNDMNADAAVASSGSETVAALIELYQARWKALS